MRKARKNSILSKRPAIIVLVLTLSILTSLIFASCSKSESNVSSSTQWFHGTASPASLNKGNPGDYYIDTDDYILYRKGDSGSWKAVIDDFGRPAQSIELQTAPVDGEDYIQWKYTDDSEWINLVSLAQLTGEDGKDGADGETPRIGSNGNWWIGNKDTGVSATGSGGSTGGNGSNGTDGTDGETPFIGENGNWWIGETDTNVKAKGEDGSSPEIVDGFWYIDGVNTYVKAEGKDGREIELKQTETHLQWRYTGEDENAWRNLVDFTAFGGAQGPAGKDGKSVKIAVNNGTIQWRYSDNSNGWQNIIAISQLKGAAGDPGATPSIGQDGYWYISGKSTNIRAVAREVQLQVTADYIQWRLEGDTDWTNLIALSAIRGEKGEPGTKGENGSMWYTGTSAPLDTLGKDGDLYLNTTTSAVYQKVSGFWGSPVCNIKGEQGEPGEKGEPGQNGTGSGGSVDLSSVENRLNAIENELANGKVPISKLETYTDEVIYDKYNLLNDTNTYSLGYIYNQANNTSNSAAWGDLSSYQNEVYYRIEDFVEVKEGATYVLFENQKHVSFMHYAWYDSDVQYISAADPSTLSSQSTLTAPEGAAYLRFSAYTSETNFDKANGTLLATLELYEQTSTTYTAPFIVATLKGVDADTTLLDGSVTPETTNFFNKFVPNLYSGRTLDMHWNPGASSSTQNYDSNRGVYDLLNPIPVTPGQIVTAWQYNSPLSFRFVVCLDSNQQRIANLGFSTSANSFTVPNGVAYVVLTLTHSTFTEEGVQIQCASTADYLGYHKPNVAVYKLKPEFYEAYTEAQQPIHVYLPEEICIATGRTIELYNSQICLEANKFHVQWVTGGFNAYINERKISITGIETDTVVTKILTFNLYDDDLNLKYTAKTTIKFTPATVGTEQLIIPIGDSLTNSKIWLTEIQNNLSAGMIKWIGTNKWTTSGTTFYHEGRSGAGTGWYNGNNTYAFNVNSNTTNLPILNDGTNNYTTNPFWNPTTNSFDFDYYCNSAADGGAGYFTDADGNPISINPTGVQIYLGTNGIKLDSTASVNNIVALVNNIKNSTKGANIPIYVVHTLFRPSQYNATNADGYASNTLGEFEHQANLKVMNLQNMLYDKLKNVANVVFVPIASTHDSEYNFPSVQVPVNPYSAVTETKYTDTVHPMEAGYKQMADIIFSTICAYSQA